MLTCKQASQIISQSLDSPLSQSERMKLRFHLFICGACTRFNQQLRLLSNAIQRIRYTTENDSTIQLSLEAKARITSAIESKNH
ncbi:MAG: zf-HC2 domain-containing protein [Methylotenera sp.]|nr:zf-HC2 domain-containing protein [Methylotenera sp.]